MIRWKFFKLRHYFLVGIFAALQGCDNSNNSLPGAEPQVGSAFTSTTELQDLGNYEQLFGSMSPFERIEITSPFNTPSIQIDYINVETSEKHSQVAVRNDKGKYAFLMLPVSETSTTLLTVSSNNIYLGQISLLPLEPTDEAYTPGEFSLDAMNSVLMGLRDAVESYKNDLPMAQGYQDTALSEQRLEAFEAAIARFQFLVGLMDDAVVFNSPIVDPITSEVLLSPATLRIVDAIYLTLLNGFIEDSIFLDGNTGTQSAGAGSTRPNFAQINTAATARLSSWDGIVALASLTMDSSTSTVGSSQQSTLDAHVKAMELVRASLLPAIVSNYVNSISEPQADAYFREATGLMKDVDELPGFASTYISDIAVGTLNILTAALPSF